MGKYSGDMALVFGMIPKGAPTKALGNRDKEIGEMDVCSRDLSKFHPSIDRHSNIFGLQAVFVDLSSL